jgi:hypothetical protein
MQQAYITINVKNSNQVLLERVKINLKGKNSTNLVELELAVNDAKFYANQEANKAGFALKEVHVELEFKK